MIWLFQVNPICVLIPSEPKITVAVNSACGNDPPLSTVTVYHSPVTLTCCVENCMLWTGKWFRRNDNGTDQFISMRSTISVNMTEEKETFVCLVQPYNDPVCFNDSGAQGSLTLIKCNT